MMLRIGVGPAVLLTDGHGGEAADVFILTFNDPQDAVLSGNGSQPGMEVTGDGGEVLHIVLRIQLVHPGKHFPQLGNVFRCSVGDDVRQRQHFQTVADGVDLLHVIGGKGVHDNAPAHDVFYETVPFQLPQGFSQRRAGNVKTIGVICFDDPFTGRNFTGNNGLFQHFVSDFPNGPAFHHRLE